MPRVYLLALCAVFGAGAGSTSKPATQPSTRPVVKKLDAEAGPDYIAHNLTNCDAILSAPPTWKIVKPQGNVVLKLVVGDKSGANVNVVLVPAAENFEPEKAAERLMATMAARFENFSRVSSEIIEVRGVLSSRVVFEGDLGGKRLRWQQTMIPAASHSYIITYAAGLDGFAKHEAELDRIVGAFKTGE